MSVRTISRTSPWRKLRVIATGHEIFFITISAIPGKFIAIDPPESARCVGQPSPDVVHMAFLIDEDAVEFVPNNE